MNAPHQGECPAALASAREAWKRGDLAALASELAAAEASLGEHPYFWFLSALWADDSGQRERAVDLLRRVLLEDDDPRLRAKALNCLGTIADDQAELGRAHGYWSRAARVDPLHTPVQVNLLKSACDRRDKLDVHVCIDRIGGLLTSRSLTNADKEYLVTRLREHPDFDWARSFDAWSKGPARWIARLERGSGPATRPRPALRGRATALAILLGLGVAWLASVAGSPAAPAGDELRSELAHSGDRGGHRPRPDRFRGRA